MSRLASRSKRSSLGRDAPATRAALLSSAGANGDLPNPGLRDVAKAAATWAGWRRKAVAPGACVRLERVRGLPVAVTAIVWPGVALVFGDAL